MVKHHANTGMRVFLIVWLGQLVSVIGSGLTTFALNVWVYQHTGSVTQFALISLCSQLPSILISPLAGALVDRWNRRWAMIISDAGAGLSIMAIALLFATGHLKIWHIYIACATSSIFSAFQWPAYSAAIPLLVPKQHLGRISGMTQLGESVAQLISPALGGVLLISIHLQGVLLIDVVTFLFSLVTLFLVQFPNVKTIATPEEGKTSLLQEVVYGWKYITARPGLLGMLMFFTADNFFTGIFNVLFTPFVLSFASPTTLGVILSIEGIGLLVGSLVVSAWGGPSRLIHGLFVFQMLGSVCILVDGLRTSVALVAVATFLFSFGAPIFNSCSHVIWQKKVALKVQGRIFAVRRTIACISLPLAYLIAGPLAEQVFQPLMSANGPLASSIGKLIGVGPGRGIGLLFIVLGVLSLLIPVVAYQYPPLRFVEDELPDAI